MGTSQKILLVDDDQDLLDVYQEMLGQLPSKPAISTANSGPRGMALLAAESYTVLVCDLNMPKMDGLQVLSIVRRKYPDIRTVVLTSIIDEQFRSRAYSLGVDMYWQKPSSGEEIKQFLECIESLLGREAQAGFRGLQSKSLVDIIQLECLSQSSAVLKITNGSQNGKVWIQDGELVDATTDELTGEAAFHKILSWKAGSFESLPADPSRPRAIFNSYQGLLLETAQAQDEAQRQDVEEATDGVGDIIKKAGSPAEAPNSELSQYPGVEFVLTLKPGEGGKFEAKGLENAEPMAAWARELLESLRALGDRLKAGPLQQAECLGAQRRLTLNPAENLDFCIGWKHNLPVEQIRESTKKLLALWHS
jgi:CheY-like chemotaxis protein